MADKELTKVRPTFVDKVSTAVIKGLLDDLLADNVLNDGEKESVLEENPARGDKARSLIDMVRMKGDQASRKMINHLKTRDPTLHTLLDLSTPQISVPSFPKEEQAQTTSSVLVPSTDAFKAAKLKKNIYPVIDKSMRSRLALIITNVEFDNKEMRRRGAEKDEQNMEMLLKSLGYKVIKHSNLSGQEIDKAVKEFSKHPDLSQTDSVFVVIMSHGKRDAILGTHWKESDPDEFPIENIYKHLNTQNCPALLNKPKVIIIQACRGAKGGSVLFRDGIESDVTPVQACDAEVRPCPPPHADEEDMEDDALRWVHKEKDFIALLSCTPDTVSYREPEKGSFLIQYIVDTFNTSAHEDHIEELFRQVMNCFEEFPSATKRQMPTKDRCTLTKLFYLFPGH
ncbi:caspase a isoform 2-T2 [Polymixia lowei]